jgi:hypothetical protein
MPTYTLKRENDYPNINLFFLLFFCGYVIIWFLQIGERRVELGDIRFEFYYAAFLSIISIFHLKKSNLSCPLYPYLFAYLILLLVQLPFSFDFQTSWTFFIDRICKFSFHCYFIVVFIRNPTALKIFLGALLLTFMKMGQEGIWSKITGSMLWESQGIMRLHGVTSLYAHPNSFSGSAIGTLPFLYYFFPISSKLIRLALIIQLFFAITIIVYTGSRTGYVALIFAVGFFIAKSPKKIKNYMILLGFSVILLYFTPNQYFERFETIFTMQEKVGHSAIKRIQIIKDSFNILKKHPFGVGIGAFPAVREEMFGRSQDTHNLYLEVATNLGIQGFIVFFLMIYNILKMLKILGKDISEQIIMVKNMIAKGCLQSEVKDRAEIHINNLKFMSSTCSAVFLFVLLRLVLGLFGHDLYEIYWWVALGVTISIYNMNKYSKIKTEDFLKN